ncbi:MAG: MBL fold metallo-hydrolase [Lachnospiraceae bacterium]|nr:MBL fold metallo-hydrolase [Lachnospiraceae bacterium]
MANPNVNEQGYIYGKFQTGPRTWTIMSRTSPQFVYLLIGDEKAALIDTFYGYGDLRQLVETITDKPVMVINTHGHYDHTGGNSFWPEAYMSEYAATEAKRAFGEELQKIADSHAYPDYNINILRDGDVIELGNHTLEIISIGAHSPGSIAILDKTERILYSGDEMEAGQVLIGRSKVPAHLETMLKLKKFEDQFDFINSAHNGTHLTKDYLEDFIELDNRLIAGTATKLDSAAGFGWSDGAAGFGGGGNRYNYGRAHMIVSER